MIDRSVVVFVAAAVTAAFSIVPAPARAQTAPEKQAPYVAPRTIDGKPDLQGIWETRNAAAFDVSEVADGHEIPYLPQALEKEQKAGRVDPIAHCALPGVPRITFIPFPIQILQRPAHEQRPEYVVLMYEYLHSQRVLPMTAKPRAHLEGIDLDMGDSVAHWEGDTLVVDVADFNDKTWLDSARHTHSDALHVVERYTRTGPDIISYEATIEDPKTYTRPWKIHMPLHRITEKGFELKEQECTEGDNGRAIHLRYRPAPKS